MLQKKRPAAAEAILYFTTLVLIPGICAAALLISPSVVMARLDQERQQSQLNANAVEPDAPKLVVVTGMIIKNGTDFVLKDPSGTVYRLDSPEKAEPFEGKSVKVTGQMDANATLLHVEAIEAISA